MNYEPCTVDGLLADAKSAGYHATRRLITDWVSVGLLDHPRRRGRGRGMGAAKGLYSGRQRQLFLTLLGKRAEVRHIKPLAQIPVFIWLYWGEEYIPLRQARRALMTWLGDARSSQDSARRLARQVLGQFNHPAATAAARRALVATLAGVAYTGRLDPPALRQAVTAVFEPDGQRRELGHPDAPLTVDAVMRLLEARLVATQALLDRRVDDEQLTRARDMHRLHLAEYVTLRPTFAASVDDAKDLYGPVTTQTTFEACCRDLLTVLGLELMVRPG